MEYYLYEEGQIVTRSATFRVARIVPLSTGDRDMAPTFPGISDSPTLESWDPPFPVDLRRVRPQDERFWEQYRTTPKAFVSLAGWSTAVAVAVWRADVDSSQGRRGCPVGSCARRVPAEAAVGDRSAGARAHGEQRPRPKSRRHRAAPPTSANTSSTSVSSWSCRRWSSPRCSSSWASSSACARSVCFARSASVLRQVRRLFIGEGLLLAVAGGVLGVARRARVCGGHHVRLADVVGGCRRHDVADAARHARRRWLPDAIGGVVAAIACIWWTLRSLGRVSRSGACWRGRSRRADRWRGGCQRPAATDSSGGVALALAVLGVALLVAGGAGWIAREGAFFGAGTRAARRVAVPVLIGDCGGTARARSPAAAGSRCRVWASATRAIVRGAACCRWP